MSKADEARCREQRLAARLKENIKRRKQAGKPQPDATMAPQADAEPARHTSDTTRSD